MQNSLLRPISPLLVTLLIAFLAAGACQNSKDSDDTKTIILAHGMPLEHPVSEAMAYMAERIDEKSKGDLNIKIYPGQQLGGERELLELVQIGTVDMVKVSGAKLENFVPAIQVLSLPYLFRNDEHKAKVLWGKVGKELLLKGREQKLRGLTYYDAGMRSFYTKDQPITEPADLAGLKIRVQESVMAIDLIQSLGGSPTPLSYGELYTALQGGIVDGAENNPPSFYSSRHYEVCKYYVLTEHTAVPDILLIGTETWNKLTEQEQQWVQQAADESAEYQRKIWEQAEKEAIEAVKEEGVEVIHPDKKPFKEDVNRMYKDFRDNQPDLYKWVKRIRNVN